MRTRSIGNQSFRPPKRSIRRSVHNFLAMLSINDDQTTETVLDNLSTGDPATDFDNMSLHLGDDVYSDISAGDLEYKGSNDFNLRLDAQRMTVSEHEEFVQECRTKPCQMATMDRGGKRFYGFGMLPVDAVMNCQNSYHLYHMQIFVIEDAGSCFICQLNKFGRIHIRPEIDDVHIEDFNISQRITVAKNG